MAQCHTPERFGLFASVHAHQTVEGLAEINDRRDTIGLAAFGVIQATLNGCRAGFILEPCEPSKRIKAEPIVLPHADVPGGAASTRRSPSPIRGVLAIRIAPLMAALA
jgi:hypothetical protein